MEKQTINLIQIAIIFSGGIGILVHVLVVPMVIDAALRDAWISILLTAVICFLWLPFLYYIHQKTAGQPIKDWLRKRYGKTITFVVLALMFLYLILMSFVTIKDTLIFISFYYAETPSIIFVYMFLIICLYNIYGGIKSVAFTSGILLPFVFLFGFFVMVTNFKYKDYTLLQPILENGFSPALKGMIYAGIGCAELIFILFFQQYLSSKLKWYHLFLIAIVLILLTLGPTIGALTEFGPVINSQQRYPAFEQWRIASIGKYIEHIDFLAIYQWFVGSFIRVSMMGILIADLLPIQSKKVKNIVIFVISLVIFHANYLPINDALMYPILYRYFFPSSLVVLILIFLILWVLALFSPKNKETSS